MPTISRRGLLGFGAAFAAFAAAPAFATAINPEDPFLVEPVDERKIKPEFRRKIVSYSGAEWPGTIIIDTDSRHLYLVIEGAKAIRYGVGVGREGFAWSGEAEVGAKKPWPAWTPPAEMVARDVEAAKWADGMPGGPDNPLGARALYLFSHGRDTFYRIHGTNQPWSIGKNVSSGCIRMLNQDIIDLYRRVPLGSRVVVMGPEQPAAIETSLY